MKKLKKFLNLLELSDEQTIIFLSILKNGSSTILQIARDTNFKRTNIYRLCEQLREKGYLIKHCQEHTTKYEAVSIDFLQIKIKEIEDKANLLKNKLEILKPSFQKMRAMQDNELKVIHYTGAEEVKQLVWNSLKARSIVKSFAYKTLSEPLGKLFIVRWYNECLERKINSQLLANPGTFALKDNVDRFTKEKYFKLPTEFWQTKTIDSKIIRITQETFIYDNVYAIIQWNQRQIFGVEIYNQQVAEQQKAIFNTLWKIAKTSELSGKLEK